MSGLEQPSLASAQPIASSEVNEVEKDEGQAGDGAALLEVTDGRPRWRAKSKYEPAFRRSQVWEAWYLFVMLLLSVGALSAYSLGLLDLMQRIQMTETFQANRTALRAYFLLGAGGLLGGTVYGAKWLYHAVAKGLWHQDRRIWRFLSPWTSLGTTVGVGALLFAGLFRAMQAEIHQISGSTLVGSGFVIGYFSDRALAKMKEVTEVLFGETRSRPGREDDSMG